MAAATRLSAKALAVLMLPGVDGAFKWHPGCLCELKESPVASDFSLPAIFGTPLFRADGKVAQVRGSVAA